MPQRIVFLSAMLTLCGPTLVTAQGSADKVQAVGQAPHVGKIKRITAEAVVISVSGRDRTVAVNELANVSFANEPDALSKARRSVDAGRYENAINELGSIDSTALRDERVKQDVLFYQALATAHLALGGASNLKAAGKRMHQFKKAAPTSHHYFEATDVLGRLAMAMGQYKAATNFFGELAGAPWKDFQLKANILRADGLLQQGKHVEALEQYRTAMKTSVDGPRADLQKSLAGIGLAVCLAETGNVDEGVKTLLDILKNSDPRDVELNAKAYNALGKCHLQRNNLKQALQAFLHTDLLYSGQRDAHAEALYHLTQLWELVDRSDRSRQARNALKSNYASSQWAKQL